MSETRKTAPPIDIRWVVGADGILCASLVANEQNTLPGFDIMGSMGDIDTAATGHALEALAEAEEVPVDGRQVIVSDGTNVAGANMRGIVAFDVGGRDFLDNLLWARAAIDDMIDRIVTLGSRDVAMSYNAEGRLRRHPMRPLHAAMAEAAAASDPTCELVIPDSWLSTKGKLRPEIPKTIDAMERTGAHREDFYAAMSEDDGA